MLNHTVHAIQGGYAVAYTQPSGHLCAVLDCATRESAQTQADRLNQHQRDMHKAAELAGLREHGIERRHERRSVRWFPDDAFA